MASLSDTGYGNLSNSYGEYAKVRDNLLKKIERIANRVKDGIEELEGTCDLCSG